MVEQPAPEPGDAPETVEHVEDLATYGLKLHLSRPVEAMGLEALTLGELQQVISDALKAKGYRVGIRAERTDR